MFTIQIGRRRSAAAVLTLFAVATLSAAVPAGSSAVAAQPPPSAVQARGPQVTLITGDVVRVVGDPEQPSIQVVTDAGPQGDISLLRAGPDVYAIPGVALPMLASGELDRELFNVSRLVRDEYADPATGELPLIVTFRTGQSARSLGNVPGAKVDRQLASIQGRAVGMHKKQTAEFWEWLSDPVPQGKGTEKRRLAPGLQRIWLDAKVKVSDDVSRATIGAEQAWAAGYDGQGQTVAVLDTGVDNAHPDLAGQVTAAQSFVPGDDPADGHGHGTHVASIIAGTGAASGGRYAGVAPKSKLINGKVLADDGDGQWSWVIAGMEWAASNATVVNMSLGGAPTDGKDPVSQALNEISERTGALFVVAAGNNYRQRKSIGTPGAADAALTVAASSRDGAFIDGYSSVGPRLDLAIKPEISAPGTGIVAARASGTSLGEPLDANYTAASGTSMATPHVAAAAAILRQQHPTWTAKQLRDALISTAKPTGGDPVWYQGAGVLNVATATAQPLHATGILDLGADAFPQQPGDTLSGVVTYTNSGDAPLPVDVSSQLWQPDQNFGPNPSPWAPPAGAVTIEPAGVTVPAGGSAEVRVTVQTSQIPYATFYGRVTGKSANGATVSTVLGFTRDVERHKLSLPAKDRDGVPVTTTGWSYGAVQNLETGAWYLVVWDNGQSTILGDWDTDIGAGLPRGMYAFMGAIAGFGPAPVYPLTSWTMLAEPEITLDRDQEFVLDAGKAGPITISPKRPTILNGLVHSVVRKNGQALLGFSPYDPATGSTHAAESYVLPSRTSARTGTFEYQAYSQFLAPPVTLQVGRTELTATYPGTSWGVCNTGDCPTRFPAHQRTTLVDAGSGSQEDIARSKVAGRYAVVQLPDDGGLDNQHRWVAIDEVAKRLAAAGAVGAIVIPPIEGAVPYYEREVASIPVALVSMQAGKDLRAAAARGPVPADLRGAFPSPYSYDLVVSRDKRLPDRISYRPSDSELAQVETRYHADSPNTWFGRITSIVGYPAFLQTFVSGSEQIRGQTSRLEFYSPNTPMFHDTISTERTVAETRYHVRYPAGRHVLDVGAGPWVPGQRASLYPVFNNFMYSRGDTFIVEAGLFTSPGQGESDLNEWPDSFSSAFTGSCDQNPCQPYRESAFGLWVQGVDGTYHINNESTIAAERGFPLSATTRTSWTVHADLDPGTTTLRYQPAPVLDWRVGSGLDNVVRTPYPVTITPSYSTLYTQSHGRFTVELWATYDDGKTWHKVPMKRTVAKGAAATFWLLAPRGSNGFVGFRAVATDAAGNQIDQTVIRAARTKRAIS